jgi:methylenetetrahydrofolate dehydrogenase (NADP+)/methenyltetrahydrofolate cyclohydrolase
MPAHIIDGNALARSIRDQVAHRVAILKQRGAQPGLAVLLVGNDPASAVYVRNKVKDCTEVGIHSVLDQVPADIPQSQLLGRIAALNQDPSIHGILVQLPLPAHIDEHAVLEAIAPHKDVDGFHIQNAGLLLTGTPRFPPCTPYGVMKLLEWAGARLEGAEAVVIGRSNIVGKPQALMLLAAGATVTLCHRRTHDLAAHTQRADIIVVAVGVPRLLTGDMVKPGAIVIDVGINRDADGKLCGDVDFASVLPVAGAITPVPGGVGPMTRAMLMVNTIEAAERYFESGRRLAP